MSFHSRLRKEREALGLMQKEMSAKLNMPPNTYNGYETGKRVPNLDTVKEIARALNVSVDYLLGSDEENETNENPEKPIKKIEKVAKENKIHTIAAHFDGADFTDEDVEDIENFIQFVVARRKKKSKNTK